MATINTYILRQTMGPLLAAVVIALLVLLTERMLRLLDLVLDTGGGLTVLLQMLAFLVPHYMALALPAAFFLGVLLAFARLHQNRELDALGSAGIGLPRLINPVLMLAGVLTLLSAANFAVGQPYARYIYRALVHDVSEAAVNVYLQERTFMEVEGATFMAERIWRNSQEFARIFIYEEDEKGDVTVMTAQRGSLHVAPKGEQSTLLLNEGVRLDGPPADARQAQVVAGDYGALRFSQFEIPIDLVGHKGFRPRGEDERELTLLELWRYRNAPPPGVSTNDMLSEFHARLVRTLSVLFLPFLAIPFALGPRRARQAYGIAAGLMVLVIYNHTLNVGESLAANARATPLVGLWLPFAVMGIFSCVLFYRSAFTVPRGARARWSPLALFERILPRPAGASELPRQHPSE